MAPSNEFFNAVYKYGMQPEDILVLPLDLQKFDTHQHAVDKVLKHFKQGWYDTLRMEAFEDNIHVSMVCPGPIFSDALKHAFTGKVGKLIAIAIANQIDEAWISMQPELSYLYLNQYLPAVARRQTCHSKDVGRQEESSRYDAQFIHGSMNYLRLVTRYARLVMNDARLVICDARLVICDARLVMRYPRLVMGYPRLVMRYPRLVMGYRDN
nr:hypothetical protein BaRGS_032084 [Batillaria attramentaria]